MVPEEAFIPGGMLGGLLFLLGAIGLMVWRSSSVLCELSMAEVADFQ